MRWLIVCALLAACGGATRRGAGGAAGDRERAAATAGWIDGHFRWIHASTDGAVHRVEIEDWWLDAHTRRGNYLRRVHVFALDGVPFECNQRLSYVLETQYDIEVASVAPESAVAVEKVRRVVPSPCATDHRGTTRYRVARAPDGDLALTWPGGRQTLRRHGVPPVPVAAAAGPRYRWSNRTVGARGDVRVELESWQLGEERGSYERRVVVFAEDGRVYPCSGEPTIDHVDRYAFEVHGTTLTEVAVEPSGHPCAGATRHLDSGELTRHGDGSVEILWRGRNRQVLAPAPQ